jgi:cold shock CspA family protein
MRGLGEQCFQGTVKFWKAQSGYGFIARSNGDADAFFHANDLKNFSQPTPGDKVSFVLVPDNKNKDRMRATDVQLLR